MQRSLTSLFTPVKEGLKDLFYPPHCEGCGQALEDGAEVLCPSCLAQSPRLQRPFCEVCSQPFSGTLPVFECINCRNRHFHFICAVAVFRARGPLRHLIHRVKYGQELHLVHPLARWLNCAWEDSRIASIGHDALVPVPLHPLRQREREFNQAEELARALGKIRKLPVWPALRRVRATVTQTEFDREERMQNLRNAFAFRHNFVVQGKRLILVDDVLTTGSTLDECARILLEAGAKSVRAITLARG